MSCIRFNTPTQRLALRSMLPAMATAKQAAALRPAPPVTETKVTRLRVLATHENQKIRESVASNAHTPNDVFTTLATDHDDGVRACVARNEAAPSDVLRVLADDASVTVRGWVAANRFVPPDVSKRLANDRSSTVRRLVAWQAGTAPAN